MLVSVCQLARLPLVDAGVDNHEVFLRVIEHVISG